MRGGGLASLAKGSLARTSSPLAIANHAILHLRGLAAKNPGTLWQIQAQIIANPCFRGDNSLLSQFVSSCSRCLGPYYAFRFLRNLSCSDVSLWNVVIRASIESDAAMQFMVFFGSMLRDGVSPDQTTFCIVLGALSRLAEDKPGEAVHCGILKMGYVSDLFVSTGLLDFYAKMGCLGSARKLFDEVPDRDAVMNNAMITTLGNHGCIVEARQLFDMMPQKSSASWNSMITCYCKCDQIDAARDLFDQNPVRDVISWNAMINGHCKLGQLEAAHELFEKMGTGKNSVTWNTMITGYVHHRQFSNALSMFQKMQAEGARPTEVTMVSLLSACAHLGALDMGTWIHTYIQNCYFQIDVILGNALIDMYCKCGSIETALQVFRRLPARNIFCWNSIITGLGMHGYGEQAIEAFHAMQNQARIKPDWVTFVGLLSGCSHSGLVSEGKRYFSQMVEVYAIEPKIEHYGCMVDLLGRAGLLKEAVNLIKQMPMKPNSVVWGSLLRACWLHKDPIISEQITQHLIELDPEDGGNYVFLSNVYACIKRWDDVKNCRMIMMEKGVHKAPGCSSIEVNNVVYEFVVGDNLHPKYAYIDAFLDNVTRELSNLGYEPHVESVLHDIEEEEKENAVKYHSEKIAVAFGLLNTRDEAKVRIVKNLRVCTDCHEFLKFISMLFKKEIVLRDRNRFHHFRQGTCSCKDYW